MFLIFFYLSAEYTFSTEYTFVIDAENVVNIHLFNKENDFEPPNGQNFYIGFVGTVDYVVKMVLKDNQPCAQAIYSIHEKEEVQQWDFFGTFVHPQIIHNDLSKRKLFPKRLGGRLVMCADKLWHFPDGKPSDDIKSVYTVAKKFAENNPPLT